MQKQITGFIPPIATPMRDGKVDVPSLERLVDYLAPYVNGYLVGGSVGENPSLTLAERILIAEVVAARKHSSHILAVSVADNALPNCFELARMASRVKADLAMVLCPTYYTNSRAMLCSFIGAIGSKSDIPLCLYDNPEASGVKLSVEDIAAIARAVPQLRHIKVTDPDPNKVAALKCGADLGIHAGDDIVLWHMLSRGADGAMVGIPMIYPEQAAAFWGAMKAGNTSVALDHYRVLTPFIHLAFGGPDYVQVIKFVLHHRGVIDTDEVRLPLLPLDTIRRREVLNAL